MILTIRFEGWFQLRLATDPDPTDEPRGASGYSFALAGEPDLDRVLRLHDPPPLTVRSHGPKIGVFVREVRLRGVRHAAAEHCLVGGRVELLDEPRLHSRNRIIGDPGHEPIDPIHVRVVGDGVELRCGDELDPTRPGLTVWEAPPELLARRGPRDMLFEPRPDSKLARATGVGDLRAHMTERRRLLLADRGRCAEPIAAAALDKRIREIGIGLRNPNDRRVLSAQARQRFALVLNRPGVVVPRAHAARLGGQVVSTRPWRLEFWLGGWDVDALSGYCKGRLRVPVRSGTA